MSPPASKDPWSRDLPDGPWDAVVIGSGVGGLTTAATLATIGKRVLVLERHLRPGGFTQTFRRGAARWDVGVHVVGEVGPEHLPGRLLARLTGGALTWASIGPVVDRVQGEEGVLAELPVGVGGMAGALDAAVPGSGPAVRRYLLDCQRLAGVLGRALMSRSLPAEARAVLAGGAELRLAEAAMARPAVDALAALPEAVRPVLALRWGYLGTEVRDLSAAALAAATAHFLDGGYYPVGGAGQIARGLAATVRAAGGHVRVGSGVSSIRMLDGRAVGVVLDDGTPVDAPVVVSAAGARLTVDRLLPAGAAPDWAEAIRALPLSMPHVALYLALDRDPRAFGADGANLWGVDPGTREVGWYASFPSLRDPSWRGPHLVSVIRLVPWADHAAMAAAPRPRPASYAAYKQEIQAMLLARLEAALPGIGAAVTHAEVATPATVLHYTGAPGAATYGLAATPARFASAALRAATPVPGLFLSGSDVTLPGVVGALLGGAVAAAAIGGAPALRVVLDAARNPRPRG